MQVPSKRNQKHEQIDRDERLFKAQLHKLPSLKPVFRQSQHGGAITDGAAAVVLASTEPAVKLGLPMCTHICTRTHFLLWLRGLVLG